MTRYNRLIMGLILFLWCDLKAGAWNLPQRNGTCTNNEASVSKFYRLLVFVTIVVLSNFGTVTAAPRGPIQMAETTDGYEPLDGTQIQSLFEALQFARYPSSSLETDFAADGSWEGQYQTGPYDAYGDWYVEGNTLCLK